MRSTFLVLATASLALSTPRIADACSPPACSPGAFVPGDHTRVPANVPGLYWRPTSGFQVVVDPQNVLLSSAAAPTTPIPFTAQLLPTGGFLLVPNTPLTVGDYLLSDRTACELGRQSGPQVAFSVSPAVPMPSDLGTLVVASSSIEEISLATGAGSCWSQATVAQASIELAPSAAAAAWIDALHFETFVDGKRWSYQTSLNQVVAPGTSAAGRARDRVFEVCASTDATLTGLAAGKHVVTMRATLPGTTTVATSLPLEVTLQCKPSDGDPPDPGTSGGCSAGAGAAPWLGLALLALVRRRRIERSAHTI